MKALRYRNVSAYLVSYEQSHVQNNVRERTQPSELFPRYSRFATRAHAKKINSTRATPSRMAHQVSLCEQRSDRRRCFRSRRHLCELTSWKFRCREVTFDGFCSNNGMLLRPMTLEHQYPVPTPMSRWDLETLSRKNGREVLVVLQHQAYLLKRPRTNQS